MFAAAATNQMMTNATVAVIIDEVLKLARSLAPPRHAAHSTKPTAKMIAVALLPLVVSSWSARWSQKYNNFLGDKDVARSHIGPVRTNVSCAANYHYTPHEVPQ